MSDGSVAGHGASLFSRSTSCGDKGDELGILPIAVFASAPAARSPPAPADLGGGRGAANQQRGVRQHGVCKQGKGKQ
jgi:hypothetical protein